MQYDTLKEKQLDDDIYEYEQKKKELFKVPLRSEVQEINEENNEALVIADREIKEMLGGTNNE